MSDRRARFETEQSMSPWILWPTPVLLVGLAVWLAMRDDVPQALVWVMAGSAAIAFLVMLGLGRMRVVVEGEEIRVTFPLGWPRMVIPLADLKEARGARLSWWWGWGLRWTPRGWLWRLRGLQAVALQRTSGRVFHVGVDEPKRLLDALAARGVPIGPHEGA
ncbi:MAG: hypothetical protein KDB73_08380 [Planctomycetes bacterium]|nr:hypothetical protein [Planctomycetota bacterium]